MECETDNKLAFLDALVCRNTTVLRETQQQIFAVFPYFGHQSQKMQEQLSSLFTKYFNDIQFNILLINNFKIGSFFIIKIDFQKICRLLWFINLVVYVVYPSTRVHDPCSLCQSSWARRQKSPYQSFAN